MINPDVIAESHRLAAAIAPELSDRPLYILEHPADLPKPKCDGYTPTGHVDVLLRDVLVERDDWRGPGTTIVLVEPSRVFDDTLGIVLHELAHNLPVQPLLDDVAPTGELRAACLCETQRWAAEDGVSAAMPSWFPDHGADFIRTCLHVHFRAQWNLRSLPVDRLRFGGFGLHLSHECDYRRVIGDEPSRMLDATFAEIHAAPLPHEFKNRFDFDMQRWQAWRNRIKNLEPKAA